MAASVMSFLEYTVLYSQLARPYSFGLLFSLSTIWFWINIINNQQLENNKLFIIHYSLFTISSCSCCIYSLFQRFVCIYSLSDRLLLY